MPQGSAETEARIFAAAAEEFAAHGFEGARVDSIARRAGVNKALLYYYIGDKNTLYSGLIIRTLEEVRKSLDSHLEGERSPESRMRSFVASFSEAIRARPWLPSLILREAANGGADLSEEARAAINGIFATFQSELSSAMSSGAFRGVNPIVAHFQGLGGILFSYTAARMLQTFPGPGRAPAPDEIPGAVSDLLLNGLLPRKAPACGAGVLNICLPL